MGRNRKKGKYKDQFYTLFKKLSPYIPDSDKLSSLIGYSIIYALHDFSTTSGSEQEVRFEEVKSVYQTIKESIDRSNENEAYFALVSVVDPIFEKIKANSFTNSSQSSLFDQICKESLSRRVNHIDYMRRCGNKLHDIVNDRGPLRRTIDPLNQDYQAIKYAFGLTN